MLTQAKLAAVALTLGTLLAGDGLGLTTEPVPAQAEVEPLAFPVQVALATTPPSPEPDGPVRFVDGFPEGTVVLAAGGDVNLGGRVGDVIAANGAGYVWSGVADELRGADVAIVNLECTISRRGAPLDKEFTFRGDPSSLAAMADAGVDVVNLGNNHAADFGRQALVDTLEHLDAAGVARVGAGRDAEEAYDHVVLSRRGTTIAFVGATRVLPYHFAAGPDLPGVASAYDEARLVDAVRRADAAADVTVVSVHWGVELATEPNLVQRRLARALVDAGADVVLGHHPHVLQPVEWLDGALVAFSLGNFVFSSGSSRGNATMLLRVGLRPGGRLAASATPVTIVGVRPVLGRSAGRGR